MLRSTRVFSKAWHWVAAGFLGVPLLILALLAIALIWAETPTGSRRLLEIVQEQLERRAATQLRYQEGSLKPLSGVLFRGLEISRSTPEGLIDIKIPELRLKYAVHLLARRLEIDEFLLKQARIKVKLHPHVQPAEKGPAKPASDWEKFLFEPPVTVEARNLVIDDLDLDFENLRPEAEQVFRLQGLSLHLALMLLKEKFTTQGRIPPGANFVLGAKQVSSESGTSQLGLKGGFSGEWDLRLFREAGEWVYEIHPLKLAFHASDVKMQTEASAGRTTFRLKSLKGATEAELSARTRELFKGSSEAVKTNKIHAEIDLGRMEALKAEATSMDKEGALALSIDSQKLRVDSALKDDIGTEALYELAGLRVPETLRGALNGRLLAGVNLKRSLDDASFTSTLSLEEEELLKIKGDAAISPEGRKALKGQADLVVRKKLLSFLQPGLAARLGKVLPLEAKADFDLNAGKDGALAGDLGLKLPVVDLSGVVPGVRSAPWRFDLAVKAERAGSGAPWSMLLGFDADNSDFGHWKIQAREKLVIASESEAGGKTAEGEIEITQKRVGARARMPLLLAQPLQLHHKAEMEGARADLDLNVEMPEVAVVNKARLSDVKFSIKASSPDLQKRRSADLRINASSGAIRLDPSLGKTPLPLEGFEFSMKGALREAIEFSLEDLRLGLNGKVAEMTAEGSMNAKNQDGQLRARFLLNLPESGLEAAGQKVKGRITIPLNFALYQGRQLNVSGEALLNDFSWWSDAKKMSASGINGRVPFSEKLDWDGANLRFHRLINRSPFERVAFERIRPLLSGAEELRVNKIQWEDRSYGPFVGFFSVEQNMLSVHQFDLDLGPGRVHGEMFFDAYPSNLQLGVLARLTGLDMNQILPGRFLKRLKPGEKVISGRTGFVLNINRGVLDGRLDITDMGADQLGALINVLDPAYEDSKMNNLRQLLRVGYPTSVSLVFSDGFMDMDIDLMILRVGQKQSLREIPLSSFLAGPTSEIVKTTEKGPLKQ